MRISDWSSDVCSSDLGDRGGAGGSGSMTGPVPTIALVGNPNAGKSSLFNELTGARQKIANYPGVTVHSQAGHDSFADGRPLGPLELPGCQCISRDRTDEAGPERKSVVRGEREGKRG